MHAGFDLEVDTEKRRIGPDGAGVPQGIGPTVEVFEAVDFWFQRPFDEVGVAPGVRIEDENGAPHPALSQGDSLFGKGHSEPVDAKAVQFHRHRVTGSVGEGLDHAHDGLVKLVPEASKVVRQLAEVEVQHGGVRIGLQCLGHTLETKGASALDKHVPPLELGKVSAVEKGGDVRVMGVNRVYTGHARGELGPDGNPPVDLAHADGVAEAGALAGVAGVEGDDVRKNDGPLALAGETLQGIQRSGQAIQIVVPGVVQDGAATPAFEVFEAHAQRPEGGEPIAHHVRCPTEFEQEKGGGQGVGHGSVIGEGQGPLNGLVLPGAGQRASGVAGLHRQRQGGVRIAGCGPGDTEVLPPALVQSLQDIVVAGAEHDSSDSLEEPQFFVGLVQRGREVGAMGVAEVDKDPHIGPDDAGEGGHFSRVGNAGFDEVHVGLVVEGPQGEGHSDLAVPAAGAPGDAAVVCGEGVGPLFDGGLAVGSCDADDHARAGEPGECTELLEGEKRIGHTQHDGARQCARPVGADDKPLDALGPHLGEVVMAVVAHAAQRNEQGVVGSAGGGAQFPGIGCDVGEVGVLDPGGGPMQCSPKLLGEGVEGEAVDGHASSRWCSRTTASL